MSAHPLSLSSCLPVSWPVACLPRGACDRVLKWWSRWSLYEGPTDTNPSPREVICRPDPGGDLARRLALLRGVPASILALRPFRAEPCLLTFYPSETSSVHLLLTRPLGRNLKKALRQPVVVLTASLPKLLLINRSVCSVVRGDGGCI